jgi:hypothetical protein
LNDRKIVVGNDFGKTFSEAAWAETRRVSIIFVLRSCLLTVSQADFQTIIESWPLSAGSNEGASSAKVPTEILYTPTGMQWDFTLMSRWK